MIGPLPQFGHLRRKPFQTAGHRGRSGACVCISLMGTLAVDRGKMGETRAELKTTGCPCVGMAQSWREKISCCATETAPCRVYRHEPDANDRFAMQEADLPERKIQDEKRSFDDQPDRRDSRRGHDRERCV